MLVIPNCHIKGAAVYTLPPAILALSKALRPVEDGGVGVDPEPQTS